MGPKDNRGEPPRGAPLWRSLEEQADNPAFHSFMEAEFPSVWRPIVARLAAGPDRRRFLKLMAASFALAGLTSCGDDDDGRAQEVPYVRNPEHLEPGAPLYYASVVPLDGYANGAVVTTVNGRPIKVEGNPQHPWSRGGTDVFMQASVLGLYDPSRSQSVLYLARGSTWEAFRGAMTGRFAILRAMGGRGLRLLTGPVTSPSLAAQIAAMQKAFPEMRWHSTSPVTGDAAYQGTQLAFGRRLETRWRFDRARVVVALDGDFLDAGRQQVGVARDWIKARHAAAAKGALLEMHAAAAVPNLTSAKADHLLVASPAAIGALADDLLAAAGGKAPPPGHGPDAQWRTRAAAALLDAKGAGIVLAGASQPAAVHAAVHRLNAALGNLGQTVFHTEAVTVEAEPLAALTQAMDRGEVETLLMLDVNPAYDAPADLRFGERLAKVGLKIHAGGYVDETASYADWHLPLAHPLESWGDARSLDGTVGLMQPTIAPLYGGRSAPEILSLLTGPEPKTGADLLRAHWQGQTDAASFAPRWQQALLDGFMPDTALPEVTVQPVAEQPGTAAPHAAAPVARAPGGLDLLFRPDPTVWDGSVANNAWLQELPKPLTKVVWDNFVSVSPRLAQREQLKQGDVVVVEIGGQRVEGPVWVLPGQADGTVAVTLGYGRSAQDQLCDGIGYNAYAVRSSASPWHRQGATLHKTGRTLSLATTQEHNTMEGHDFVRVQTLGAAPVGDEAAWTQPTLYTPPYKDDGRAWGMVIDLDSCIGCNACVVACQSENNIAVVGREQAAEGRWMQWLRIDRYYQGEPDDPATYFQPVPCMHCEQAPCEVGCPVEATLHDHEGLNLMVYNRCIGTRACSGYCPYKVRRFNYLDYSAGAAPSIQEQRNPDVTVRGRGVMEKCTYCVQRIAEARIQADKGDGVIPDGAVKTACQGACPTRAITFGDLSDSKSAVAAARHDPRNYALLGELNTRPRTTYLARLAPAETPLKMEG